MYWDYILSIIGVAGFVLAGKKIWWAWYVNIAAQFVWVAYALITNQHGFLIGAAIYFIVFIKNAYDWTKEHMVKVNIDRALAAKKAEHVRQVLDGVSKSMITQEQIREDLGVEIRHDV